MKIEEFEQCLAARAVYSIYSRINSSATTVSVVEMVNYCNFACCFDKADYFE